MSTLDGWPTGKQSLRESTRQSYEVHVRRYLKPHLGDLPLVELRPAHIERMYRLIGAAGDQERGVPLSVASVRCIHATLTSALSTAVRRGLIERNPAATVELPPVRRPTGRDLVRGRPRPLPRRRRGRPAAPAVPAARSGGAAPRRGGGAAMARRGLNQGLLRVEQSAVKVGRRAVIGPPKSASGARTIALDDETCRRLQWHAARQRLDIRRETGTITVPELVFTTAQGEPVDPTYVSRRLPD